MYEDDPMKSLTGRPPTAQQQYRATNAASGGGKHPASASASQGSMYPTTPRGRITSGGLNSAFTAPMSQPFAQNAVQALSNTPQQRQGFDMDPIAPRNLPMQRSAVPAWSLSGGVSPETERAALDFNSAARPPAPLNVGKIISDRITENMNNASVQGRQDANDIVDRNLKARTGYYSTPQARRGGFFQRGMGPMAGDAAIMQNQNRPLGDGGPAAAAARADQERRRVAAGPQADGLTRYTPNQDLLQFANQDRAKEDERIAGLVGGGTNYRPALESMTPSQIQYYRHRLNMLTNPAYANRVNSQRSDRQEMLDNRRDMVQARREGALQAAGASQQMRNLMAGRGTVGPGADGMGALMGLTAQANPALALNQAGQMAMMDRRAQLERDMMDRATRMSIYSSGMSGPEIDLALQRLDAANGGGPVTSPLQVAGSFVRDPSLSPMDAYLAFQQWKENAVRAGATITPEQERQIMMANGINPSASDLQQWRQDNETLFTAPDYTGGFVGQAGSHFILNPLLRWLGLDPASQMKRESMQRRLNP